MNDRKVRYAFDRILKKGKVRKCLLASSECSGAAIESHSIQNAVILEGLSEDGHVFTLRPSIEGQGPKLKYTGRNIASTFPGFCSHHDTELFREIDFSMESVPSDFSKKQLVLFFLRVVSIEGWKKQSSVNSFEDVVAAFRTDDFQAASKILGIPEEMARDSIKNPEFLEWNLLGNLKGLEEAEKIMGSLLWQIDKGKLHGTISHHWSLNLRSNVAVVSGVSPLWDTVGQRLYGEIPLSNGEKMRHMGLTIFEVAGKTNVIMSYLKKDADILQPLVSQITELVSNAGVMKKWMTEFILENCENVVFRPSFINGLSALQKEELEKASGWSLMQGGPSKKDFSFCFFE